MIPSPPRRSPIALILLLAGLAACDNATVPDLPEVEPVPIPDPADVDAVVFLLGDGGATLENRSPVLSALTEDVETWSAALARDSAVSIIYPGDIVYPVGVRDRDHPEFPQDSVHLWNQIRLVNGPAALQHATIGLFLAGNHDWGNQAGDAGMARLRNLEGALASARETGPKVVLLPEPGDPGPVVRDLRRNVRLVLLDTHWFLQARSEEDKDAFFDRVAEALTTAGDRQVIMVQHHPLRSAGPHGALLPGPRALGVEFLLKKTGTLVQDLDSPIYAELHRRLMRTFRDTGKPPLAFVGGHDHSLQVLGAQEALAPRYVLVSGAGSKLTPITSTDGMWYGASRPGYMFLVFRKDDAVDLYVVGGDPNRLSCEGEIADAAVSECMMAGVDSMDVRFSMTLLDPSGREPTRLARRDSAVPSTPWWNPDRVASPDAERAADAERTAGRGGTPDAGSAVESGSASGPGTGPAADAGPDATPADLEAMETGPPPAVARRRLLSGLDSVTAAPGETYPANAVERWLFGDLNRHLWRREFTVPVLSLDSLGGGVVVEEVSGGKQTLGLRMRGENGIEYQFRSIVKDATRLLPDPIDESALTGLLDDQMAAQFPLAAMVVAEILETAGVDVAKPAPVVLPDDERLGEYREAFAGRMGWVEVRPDEREGDRPGWDGSSKVTGSEELYEELAENPDSRVDAPALIRARLIDMLVGDWDRHSDQWRWASFEEDGRIRWEPIPRDRDWAFARIDGLITRIGGWIKGDYIGFSDEHPDVSRLVSSADNLERRLLGEVDRDEYLRQARELRAVLTDSALAAAVDVLPPTYLVTEREWLLEGLTARRDALLDVADEWYALRAEEVDVFGTEQVDVFEVTRTFDGLLTVLIRTGSADGPVRFERTFRPGTTETVRLHWTEGQDIRPDEVPPGEIAVEWVEFRGLIEGVR
ncbi:MAG TPA: hypothetical protein VK858_13460 [Longimicrobiales bacterium]|nr:hypothetical protein [Longimicrobiales bacterium]